MQSSVDSKFDGNGSYSLNGGTFYIKSSDLPQSGSYHSYDLALGENGGTVYIDVNAITGAGKTWVFNVTLPKGSTGVDFYYRMINHTGSMISASTVYNASTDKTHLYFYTKNNVGNLSYIEIILPGHPFKGNNSSSGPLPPGGEVYCVEAGYCFLAGALIDTDLGRISVEALEPGQKVMTFDDQGRFIGYEPVTWKGQRVGHVQGTGHDDLDNRPVRVSQGAFAENVPDRDLQVTPEHCFLVEGVLVPARMLVNNRTVSYVTTCQHYDYYHFKTARHAIVRANGTLTETLRDDIRHFLTDGADLGACDVAQPGAAPLCSDPVLAEAIHSRIEKRAASTGGKSAAVVRELTEDAELHLVLADGTRLMPVRVNARWAAFSLPAGQSSAYIVSRSSRPCDVVGPFLDDRRKLGVLVGEVNLFAADESRCVSSHLDMTDGDGWHEGVAGDTARWTNGCALLSLGEPLGTQSLLTIELIRSGPYLARSVRSEDLARAA